MDKLLKEISEEPGWFFENVDKRGGLLVLKEQFLKEAAEDSQDKAVEAASIIGWNKCSEYHRIHARYYENFRMYSDRHPPVNY